MKPTERRYWLAKHLEDFESATKVCPPEFADTPHYRFAVAFRKPASKEEDLCVLLGGPFLDQSDPDASTMQRWKVSPSLFRGFDNLLEDSELFAVLLGYKKSLRAKTLEARLVS